MAARLPLSSVRVLATLCPLLFLFADEARASNGGRIFTFVNKCTETVWVGTQGNVLLAGGGWELAAAGGIKSITAPSTWSGRFWGRTGCLFNPSGVGKCETGDCGGLFMCGGLGGTPPATLAEFTLGAPDFYDVSLVDGFNVPINVVPIGGGRECHVTGCDVDINAMCPPPLRVATTNGGRVVACRSACNAFAQPQFCCTGAYATPTTCRASNFSLRFKRACPHAYTFAFDDPSSTFTCSAPQRYLITFCH